MLKIKFPSSSISGKFKYLKKFDELSGVIGNWDGESKLTPNPKPLKNISHIKQFNSFGRK